MQGAVILRRIIVPYRASFPIAQDSSDLLHGYLTDRRDFAPSHTESGIHGDHLACHELVLKWHLVGVEPQPPIPFALNVACASKRSRSAGWSMPFDFGATRLRSGQTGEAQLGLNPNQEMACPNGTSPSSAAAIDQGLGIPTGSVAQRLLAPKTGGCDAIPLPNQLA